MAEKRLQVRYEVCLTARLQGSPAGSTVRIADLSAGGCYVDTIAEVSVGQRIVIEILDSNRSWVKFEGVVAHHSPRLGFGVRFVNLNEEQCQQIRNFLTEGDDNVILDFPKRETATTSENPAPVELDVTSHRLM